MFRTCFYGVLTTRGGAGGEAGGFGYDVEGRPGEPTVAARKQLQLRHLNVCSCSTVTRSVVRSYQMSQSQ
jgi:hypothetical protein